MIENIPAGKYHGYLWKSDEIKPLVIKGDLEELSLDSSAIPFIVEGELFNLETKISYSIRFFDGEYHVKEFNTRDLSESNSTRRTYAPNFPKGEDVKGLNYVRIWKPEKDDLCCGFPVLRPAEMVFVGFNL